MSNLTAEQEAQIEADDRRTIDDPWPRELRDQIAGHIEAHTINMYLKHRDVMECIEYAYPLIRDWLRDHPDDLAGAS
jgi:hypothetical protein